MKKLIILLLIIIFVVGCINQNNITPSITENETLPEDVTPSPLQNETPLEPTENATSPSPPVPKTYDVKIRNFVYTLTTTTINVGDSVRWTNFDVVDHTATADDGSFDTGLLSKEQSAMITFDKSGTYNYYCISHSWMRGKIIVK